MTKFSSHLQEQLRQVYKQKYNLDSTSFLDDVRHIISPVHDVPVPRPHSVHDRPLIIDVRSVGRFYQLETDSQPIQALGNVSCQIATGEFVALMGPSGSGKTTLLQLIGGLDTPSQGQIIVGGQSLEGLSDQQLSLYRNQTIGFVFQFFYLQPFLTVERNVEVPLLFRATPRTQRQKEVARAIAAVGLTDRTQHLPHQLSGGQMQRVAIARALVTEPRILLADEPTGNLDQATGQEILQLLKQINQSTGTTLLVVTHDPSVAAQADRIIQLADGQIV